MEISNISLPIDIIAVCLSLAILSIAQTKTALVTCMEFIAYNLIRFIIEDVFLVVSPLTYLVFIVICFFSFYFHVKCTSHWLIITSFILPMGYNLGMFYEWGMAAWANEYTYLQFDKYYTPVMLGIMALQLLSTAIYGGLRDGLSRWRRNIGDRTIPYLRIVSNH